MKQNVRAEAVVDLSAADDTSAFTMDAPGNGFVHVKQIWGRYEEAVASGGFTSTGPVASIEVGGTEVATVTVEATSAARAIGDTVQVTVDGTNVTNANGVFAISEGDTIECVTKTQGVGGTVTGTIRFYIPCEFDLE